MKASEFCYWLQGYFEIKVKGSANCLMKEQVEVIEKHLKLVSIHDPIDGKAKQFCQSLQGLVAFIGVNEITSSQTAKIREKLGQVFLHEIDPSYPVEQQEALNQAHVGIFDDPAAGYRC